MTFNRDEYFSRPTELADFWADMPGHENVLAGRDVHPDRTPGTWLGVSKTGRVGALTNYRVPFSQVNKDARGRGSLVTDFLRSNVDAVDYLHGIAKDGHAYNGFNLLLADLALDDPLIGYYTNLEKLGVQVVPPGIYGLCNKVLDSPWPKLLDGKRAFTDIIYQLECEGMGRDELIGRLFELMSRDTTYAMQYPDERLPSTGVPLTAERALSAIKCYLSDIEYGTRSTTIVLVDDHNHVTFVEKAIDPDTREWHTNHFEFKIEPT